MRSLLLYLCSRLFLHMSALYINLYASTCLLNCPSTYVSIYLSICLQYLRINACAIYLLPMSLSIYLSIYLSIDLSIYPKYVPELLEHNACKHTRLLSRSLSPSLPGHSAGPSRQLQGSSEFLTPSPKSHKTRYVGFLCFKNPRV